MKKESRNVELLLLTCELRQGYTVPCVISFFTFPHTNEKPVRKESSLSTWRRKLEWQDNCVLCATELFSLFSNSMNN